uniref:Uncharacterized protein n=1 Tax=Romanomermis culicivorax TaxID=13658 RepID=A0A915HZD2_ROMCU
MNRFLNDIRSNCFLIIAILAIFQPAIGFILSPMNGTLTGTTNSENIIILILLLFLIITVLAHLAQDGVDYWDQISSSVTVAIMAVTTSSICQIYHLRSNVLPNVTNQSTMKVGTSCLS